MWFISVSGKGVIVMKPIELTSMVLLIISGVLWGLVGLFDFNLLDCIIGTGYWLTRLINFFFGAAAIWVAVYWRMKRRAGK